MVIVASFSAAIVPRGGTMTGRSASIAVVDDSRDENSSSSKDLDADDDGSTSTIVYSMITLPRFLIFMNPSDTSSNGL